MFHMFEVHLEILHPLYFPQENTVKLNILKNKPDYKFPKKMNASDLTYSAGKIQVEECGK